MARLHIVNGSGTAYGFKDSQLAGEMMVWNEALALGPVTGTLGSEEFWNMRARYFDGLYQSSDRSIPSYLELMGEELPKLHPRHEYDSINLWFEHDYFCQVNMMGVLSWIKLLSIDTPVNLVCINQFPGIDHFRGLGQLEPQHFAELWPQRNALTKADLRYAHQAWQWYSGEQPHLDIATAPTNAFPYWSNAMELHRQRFPQSNGLNQLQNWVLQVINENQFINKSLVRHLLLNQGDWGFGDLQYEDMLDNLASCIKQKEPYQLNRLGLKVIHNQEQYAYPTFHIGGVLNTDFHWNEGSLLART